MKSLFIGAVVVSALTFAGVAMAQEKPEAPAAPASSAPAAVTVVAPPKTVSPEEAKRLARQNEVICYNDFDVGSHVRHTRVCLTRAQREEIQHDNAEAWRDMTSSLPTNSKTYIDATPKGLH